MNYSTSPPSVALPSRRLPRRPMSLHGILVSRAGISDNEDASGAPGVLLGVGQPYEVSSIGPFWPDEVGLN